MASLSPESSDDELVSSINITPFVDVVLVLLVIFMVTAPMLAKDNFPVQLPKSSQTDSKTVAPLGVSITSQGQTLLQGQPVSLEELSERARSISKSNPEAQAMISADSESKHANLVSVMDALKQGGIQDFGLVVEKTSSSGGK